MLTTDELQSSAMAACDVPQDLNAPHYENYFGAWACQESFFRAAFDRVARENLRDHAARQRAKSDTARAEGEGEPMAPRPTNFPVTETGIAVLTLSGVLMKHVGSMEEGTSTVLFRRQLRAAMNNPAIAGILILIDSPGGAVAGTMELAEDIAAAAAKKPTHAYIQDLGASAAYWAASQATVISTNVMGIVGSIGTYMPVYDFSGWAEQQGIRVEIVKEGEFKGAGTPGTQVTPEQIAEWQRTVTALNAQFVAGVAKGRQLSDEAAKKLNDGRVHVGAAAKALKLVDYVETFEQSLKRLEGKSKSSRSSARAAAEAGIRLRAEGGPEVEASAAAENPAMDPQTIDAGGGSAGVVPSALAPVAGAESEMVSMSTPTQTQAPAGTIAAAEPPKAATMSELKSACPGAPNDFLVEQAEKNATVQQAKDAYLAFQNAQIRARDEELAKLKASAAQQPAEQPKAEEPKKAPGMAPIGSKSAEQKQPAATGDTKAEFEGRVSELVKGGKSRADAVSQAVREDPGRHQAYLDAAKKK